MKPAKPIPKPSTSQTVRFVKGFTIDDAKSLDLDDALWLEPLGDGWLLQIHIADVDHLVPQGSFLDTQAAERVETLYGPKFTNPMLPRSLSEGNASLLPQQERRVITTEVKLDQNLEIVEITFRESLLTSVGRLSYDEATHLPETHVLKAQLTQLEAIAFQLQLARKRRGAMFAVEMTLDGEPVYVTEGGLIKPQITRAEQLIAELMILNNFLVASYCQSKNYPFLYRVHDADPGEDATVRALIDIGNASELRRELLRYQQAALYTVAPKGHFGLNLTAYAHTTSPIRRYVDLVNQRLLKSILKGAPLPYSQEELVTKAEHINERRKLIRTSRSHGYKEAAYAQAATQIALPPEDLSKLPTKEFSRVLQAALQRQAIDHLLPEVLRRLKAKLLAHVDLYRIFFEGSHLALKGAVLELLQDSPDVISVVMLAGAKKPDLYSQPDLRMEGDHPAFQALFVLSVSGKPQAAPQWVTGITKEAAKRSAYFRFLTALVYEELVSPDDLPSPEANMVPLPLARPMTVEAITTDTNFIGLLNNHSQTRGGTVQFSFETPRLSYFIATCTYGERHTKGEGTNKKVAKSRAAEQMWSLLQKENA